MGGHRLWGDLEARWEARWGAAGSGAEESWGRGCCEGTGCPLPALPTRAAAGELGAGPGLRSRGDGGRDLLRGAWCVPLTGRVARAARRRGL